MTQKQVYEVVNHPDFWGRCMFAESFRMEMAGQYSLVGCYIGGITVKDFPATLPTLAFFIETALNPLANIPSVTYRAYMPGADESDHFWEAQQVVRDHSDDADAEVSPDESEVFEQPFPGPAVTRLFTAINNPLLEVPRAGDIRVRAFIGDKVYPLGSVSIIKAEDESEA